MPIKVSVLKAVFIKEVIHKIVILRTLGQSEKLHVLLNDRKVIRIYFYQY